MPGTKRNDSHGNKHQHQFFHDKKGKKINLLVKPDKRHQDLHEKTFQKKGVLEHDKFLLELEQIDHLQILEDEREEARHRLMRLGLENLMHLSRRQSWSSGIISQSLNDYTLALIQTLEQEEQSVAFYENELEESGSRLSL